MCKTDNLQAMMRNITIMSAIEIVCGVALIIAGAVATSYSIPDYCEDVVDSGVVNSPSDPNDPFYDPNAPNFEYGNSECQSDKDEVNGLLRTIALWGMLPAIVPIVFGILGFIAANRKLKPLVGVVLAFTIVGVVLCLVGVILPFFGATIITSVCENDWDPDNPTAGDIRSTKEGKDFCDRYAGSLWAVVVLNIILAILQFVFSIILCCACCANQSVWDQANGGAVPGTVPMQPMGGVAQGGVPAQPAQYNIPEATAVK